MIVSSGVHWAGNPQTSRAANILTMPTCTSPPDSFSTATEPGWSVTSKDSCQWFMAGTEFLRISLNYWKYEEPSGSVVNAVDMCTCWLAPCVLIALACFHPVPLESSSRLTYFTVSNPVRDLRGWQTWFIAVMCCQLESRKQYTHLTNLHWHFLAIAITVHVGFLTLWYLNVYILVQEQSHIIA